MFGSKNAVAKLPPPLDFEQLEADIAGEAKRVRKFPRFAPEDDPDRFAPPEVREAIAPPLPDYVEHADGVDQISKLTAGVVIEQHEQAAQTIEQMRAPLEQWAKAHQLAIDDLGAAMKYIDETAQRLRDVGKSTFEKYQKSTLVISEIRKTCEDIREKVETPA